MDLSDLHPLQPLELYWLKKAKAFSCFICKLQVFFAIISIFFRSILKKKELPSTCRSFSSLRIGLSTQTGAKNWRCMECCNRPGCHLYTLLPCRGQDALIAAPTSPRPRVPTLGDRVQDQSFLPRYDAAVRDVHAGGPSRRCVVNPLAASLAELQELEITLAAR